MIDYQYLETHPDLFPSVIGINEKQFNAILKKFVPALRQAEYCKAWSHPRKQPPGAGHPYKLRTDAEKLFFLLFYYKVYPTFRLAQAIFSFDKRNVQLLKQFLEPVLFKAMGYQLELPKVRARYLDQIIEICPQLKEFIIDATERKIRRPKDKEKQEFYYSGKKKQHTVKNQVLVNPHTKKILSVSVTVEGKMHDKKLAENDPALLYLPPKAKGAGDSGYQGLEADHLEQFVIPQKKPRGIELTELQKQTNTTISKIRVRVEHPFAWLKHFGILSQTFRSQIPLASQPFFNIACLYNYCMT
jgi:hypothetical protein